MDFEDSIKEEGFSSPTKNKIESEKLVCDPRVQINLTNQRKDSMELEEIYQIQPIAQINSKHKKITQKK